MALLCRSAVQENLPSKGPFCQNKVAIQICLNVVCCLIKGQGTLCALNPDVLMEQYDELLIVLYL